MGALKEGIKEEELPGLVHAWRIENPNIVNYWKEVYEAAVTAIQKPGMVVGIEHGIRFHVRKGILFIRLPNGRELSYISPKLEYSMVVYVKVLEDGEKYKKDQKLMMAVSLATKLVEMNVVKVTCEPFENISITYLGMNQTTKQWGKQYTYGGKLVENITQAVARDCLAEKIILVSEKGYPIVLHVHDEIVTEVIDGTGSLEQLNDILSKPIPWARGLPLGADGFTGKYYKK